MYSFIFSTLYLLIILFLAQWLAGLFKKGLDLEDAPAREKVIPSLDITGVAEFIKSGKCKHIITMAGAGISTCKNDELLACRTNFLAMFHHGNSFEFFNQGWNHNITVN